jgi:hypothetical protein
VPFRKPRFGSVGRCQKAVSWNASEIRNALSGKRNPRMEEPKSSLASASYDETRLTVINIDSVQKLAHDLGKTLAGLFIIIAVDLHFRY